MYIIVNGKIVSRGYASGGTSYRYHFDTKERPEKIVIWSNDEANCSHIIFDANTKKVIR
jgi:hypothetical protein